MHVCLYACLSVCLHVYLHVCLSVCMAVYVFMYFFNYDHLSYIMIRLFIKGTWHQIWPIWHRRKTKKQQSGNNTNTISIQCHWYSVRIISTLLFYIKKGHHPVISKGPFHCCLHWPQRINWTQVSKSYVYFLPTQFVRMVYHTQYK